MQSHPCKRKDKRVVGAIQVTYKKYTEVVINVGISGVAFKTPKNFNHLVRKSLPITLSVPISQTYPNGMTLNLEGEVKYARFDKAWNSYMVGVHYKKLSKEHKAKLVWLIDFLDKTNLYWGEKYNTFE